MKPVGLRVDVDTLRGSQQGVARLLKIFEEEGVRATFFLTLGPDNAGKAIRNIFKPGFLKKMLRTNALRMYGLRTVVSGLLLPAPVIGQRAADSLAVIAGRGHEVGLHAWDHRLWQDRIDTLSEKQLEHELGRGAEMFRQITGSAPRAFAAPSWRTSAVAQKLLVRMGVRYASDLRSAQACRLSLDDGLSVVQVPASSDCLEEFLTRGISDEGRVIDQIVDQLQRASCPVITVHAEVEGGIYGDYLRKLIQAVRTRVGPLVRLDELVKGLNVEELPVLELGRVRVEGRACEVSAAV